MTKALQAAIDKLEPLVVADPDLAKQLAKPAKAKDLAALAKALFGGKLPDDLATWFAWHDGQAGFTGLNPEENWTMLSAKDALGNWKFLNDPAEDIGIRPARASLLPLFDNGGGDHLMYETAGKLRGALYIYWHDDEDPPKKAEHPGLASWVERATKERTKYSKAKRVKLALDYKGVKFVKVKVPSEVALEAAPIGATYYRSIYLPMWNGNGIWATAKATAASWVEGYARKLGDALTDLQDTVAKQPEKKWSRNVRSTHYDLTNRVLDKYSPVKVPKDVFLGQAKL